MGAGTRNAIIAGCVVLAAAGGGAAYFLTKSPAGSLPTVPVAAAPDKSPDPGAAKAPESPSVHYVNFVQQFSLVRDSAAYVGASFDSPQLYPLHKGTGFISVSKSPDGTWVVAMTADGQAAFLPAADLGPYDPHANPQLNLAQSVSGTANVIDTATLSVGGKTIALIGITGETGDPADEMQKMINDTGGTVKCQLVMDAYQCFLSTGLDLARTALYNGGAEVAPDASADYHTQAQAAQAGHRGRYK
jgi:hypothetical protein